MKKFVQASVLFLLVCTMPACSTTINSKVTSVSHIDNLKGSYRLVSYRIVPAGRDTEPEVRKMFNGLNEIYPDGFTKITFSSDEDLERILIEKRMSSFGTYLHPCQTDWALYSGSVYRLNTKNTELYHIFIPKDLKLAITEYTSLIGRDLDKISLPEDLNELCITVSLYKHYGEEIKLSLGDIKSLIQEKGPK